MKACISSSVFDTATKLTSKTFHEHVDVQQANIFALEINNDFVL